MNPSAWLQAAALLAWGATLGLGLGGVVLGAMLGAVLIAMRRLATTGEPRLHLNDAQLNRSVDITAALCALTLVALLAVQGLPAGLLSAMGWMPAALLPLMLVASLNQAPLRLRHLALSLRRSRRPEADQSVDPDPLYLAVILLAAAVQTRSSAWLFWALGGLLAAWLFAARPAPRRRGLAPFLGATALALALAYGASHGLQRVQLVLQDWAVDALSGVDDDPYQSQTRIGDLGRVKLSERIVWRLEQKLPADVPLLLRTGVFTHYANGAWQAQRDAFAPLPAGAATPARLILRGDSQQGAALLPMPANHGGIIASGRLERNPLGVIRLSEAPPLLEVTVGQRDATPPAPAPAGDLAIAPGLAALLEKLPEVAALRAGTERERLAGLEAWFATNFRYTLFIGDDTQGRRDLERFLLTDRAGHCEYFATATVLLLRGLGVPARYVTGYSVQEFSRLEKAFVVRKRHAHAWAEAFVDGRWVEVDTTPATWLSVEEDAAPLWQPALDFVYYAWRMLGELRRDLLAGDRSGLVWAAGMLLLLGVFWLVRKRPWQGVRSSQKVGAGKTATTPASSEQRAFHALESQLAAIGLARRTGEAPRRWLARLIDDGRSVLDSTRLESARQVIEALYLERYGPANFKPPHWEQQ